ncbi:hypothetical protein N2152v2_001997 [Parachlorella kessleri]
MEPAKLTLDALKGAYQQGTTPTDVAQQLFPKVAASKHVFLGKPTLEDVVKRCSELESLQVGERGQLWGIPFAVKDNIDVAGFPTTCACPDFAYTPEAHAPVVQALLDAGGVFMGKTNLDQFACGLVGTRTPYGVPANAFDDRFVPGGSSCGSAVAVAEGMVSFALGTDTAGSGRVPAGLNGIVGIKPSVGRFSTRGVVPACYLLDCVSVFALTAEDGHTVATIMENDNIADPTYRPRNAQLLHRQYSPGSPFRFALPQPEFLDFSGPGGEPMRTAMEQQMAAAAERLQALGGQQVDIDFAPFAEAAALLYGAPFVAERYAGIRAFLEGSGAPPPGSTVDILPDERLLKVIRAIISRTSRFSAADVFAGLQRLSELKAAARVELAKFDVLVVPTAAYNYTVQEVQAEEDDPSLSAMLSALPPKNANLGRFTNFVNLLDMCGVSVYSGLLRVPGDGESEASAGQGVDPQQARRRDHLAATGNPCPVLPFGITLLGPAWTDAYVAALAAAYGRATGLAAGPAGHGVVPYRMPSGTAAAAAKGGLSTREALAAMREQAESGKGCAVGCGI